MDMLPDSCSRASLREAVCWTDELLLQELRRPLDEAESVASTESIRKGVTLVTTRACNVYASPSSKDLRFQLPDGARISAAGALIRAHDLEADCVPVQDGPKDGFVHVRDVVAKVKLASGPASWAKGPHARSNWLPVGRQGRLQLCVGGWPFRLPGGYGIAAKPRKKEWSRCRLCSLLE
eukprot:TRINITY_DN24792_c0_g1_i1.p2 TRINITY_DN24792_c0_g1~~TRINITY_DN24792_c0_g1_i1.p2  ORF type:complete len:179 (-),score=19.08 TRINITY_DN24792_c0_g1_i1:487-1023(-)